MICPSRIILRMFFIPTYNGLIVDVCSSGQKCKMMYFFHKLRAAYDHRQTIYAEQEKIQSAALYFS